MKRFIAALVIAGAALPLSAQDQTATTDPVIVRAEGVEIRQSELNAAIASLPEQYQAMAQGPAKRRFAEEYVRMRLLAREAEKANLANDPEVKVQLALARSNTLAAAQLERIEQNLNVTEEQIKQAYEAQKDTLEQVSARHILIAPTGSPAARPDGPQLTDEQAKARAEELRTKILAGADFAELAKTESADQGSGARGGDLGSFGRGMMVPEFEEAAFSQEPGKVGQVVKTQFGYHLIVVDERGTTPLEEIRPELEQQLRQQAMQKRIEDLVSGAKVTYEPSAFPEPAAAPAAPATPSNP